MGLKVLHQAGAMEPRMLIDTDILQVAKRINTGEASVGWEGDRHMFVEFNFRDNTYEIWRQCEFSCKTCPHIVKSWGPRQFDTRVLRWLADNDAYKHDIQKRVDQHNARVTKEREETLYALETEAKEILYRGMQGSYLPGVGVHNPGQPVTSGEKL